MDYRYKQLEQELSALSKVFSDLGVRLSEVAKEVTSPGVMPSEKLLEQISASRTSFENCRTAIHGHAGAMLVSPLPKVGELVSITTIDTLLKASAAAEETKFSIETERAKALEILGRVLAITHREAADFKPLQECHAKLGELRSAISNVLWPHRHPESESIVASKHPATALLAFVETLDTLEDEKWMALETTISDTYGKPLFVAASRGKLAVAAEGKGESKPVAAAPPAKAPVVAPPEPPKPVAAAPPEPPKPVVASEKPVEKKLVAEKPPERPAPAPVPPPPVVAAPAPVMEKKIPAPPIPAAPAPAAVASIGVAVAAEKKEVAQDKIPQKPTTPPAITPAPVTPAAATPTPVAAIPPAPVASPEKKEVVEKLHQPVASPVAPVAPTVAIPVAPVPAAPHAVASVVSTPAPAAHMPPAPVAVTPAAPSRPAPVPVAATPAAPAAVPSAPPVAGNSHATPQTSLSALATATESVSEKRPTASAAVETIDKQRKEPRLAASAPQPVAVKAELSNEEFAADEAQKAANGDPSQRPQRWGFWRGNR